LRSTHLNLGLELDKIFLIIEHDGEYFIGTLMIDDAAFRRQVRELLQRLSVAQSKRLATWT
jgi:hypothetical protein